MEDMDQQANKKMKRALLLLNAIFLAIGTCGGPMVIRLYFIHGGNRVWLSSWLQTGGWPINFISLLITYLHRHSKEGSSAKIYFMERPVFIAATIIGVLTGLNDYLYAYGVALLPVSTTSLVLASQLAFTAVFAFLLVKQKFTPYSPLATAPCSHKLIPWSPPPSGNIKLNTDGCRYESNGKAGFGGIFRNEQGEWILGYYGKMVAGSSLETEVWSIYRGLTIILEKGLTNTHIESDSQTAIILFNEGANANHPQSNIINDGKYLISRTGSTLSHTYRDANQCADHLAHLGAGQEEELVVTMTPPTSIREYMLRDTLNIRQILD